MFRRIWLVSGDGEIAFSAGENKGERRYADLVICDRHGETVHVVTVAQVGVQLDPAETLIKTDYTAKTYSLDVVSNASWTVSREDEQQEWFSFEKTSFEGSDKLVITIGENPNTSIRNATIILRTIKAEGVTQVEKRIVLRQANDPVSGTLRVQQRGTDQMVGESGNCFICRRRRYFLAGSIAAL